MHDQYNLFRIFQKSILAIAILTAMNAAFGCGMAGPMSDVDASGGSPADSREDKDGDGYAAGEDCNDDDPSIHPEAEELCDAVDRDCDGDLSNGVLGQGAECAALDCTDIADAGGDDGVYIIDPDGPGRVQSYPVYCNNTIAGGGWQLVSVRHSYARRLFDPNYLCDTTERNCSGTIPLAQIYQDSAPELLFATIDNETWLQVDGMMPPRHDGLLDMITGLRPISASDHCDYPNLCNESRDNALGVSAHSDNFEPRSRSVAYQWAKRGGLWFAYTSGGHGDEHVVSMNYAAYCGKPGGLDISSAEDGNHGNVACGVPGAVYFRYSNPDARRY